MGGGFPCGGRGLDVGKWEDCLGPGLLSSVSVARNQLTCDSRVNFLHASRRVNFLHVSNASPAPAEPELPTPAAFAAMSTTVPRPAVAPYVAPLMMSLAAVDAKCAEVGLDPKQRQDRELASKLARADHRAEWITSQQSPSLSADAQPPTVPVSRAAPHAVPADESDDASDAEWLPSADEESDDEGHGQGPRGDGNNNDDRDDDEAAGPQPPLDAASAARAIRDLGEELLEDAWRETAAALSPASGSTAEVNEMSGIITGDGDSFCRYFCTVNIVTFKSQSTVKAMRPTYGGSADPPDMRLAPKPPQSKPASDAASKPASKSRRSRPWEPRGCADCPPTTTEV